MLPVIAISIGDVYGIGPEVVLKAFTRSDLFTLCRPVVYGPASVLPWYKNRVGTLVELQEISDPSEAKDDIVSLIDTGGAFVPEDIGRATAAGGEISIKSVTRAYEAVVSGAADAIVTAPISKEAIAMAGSPFKGHTEMLASMCGHTDDFIMILSSNTMKVGLVTIHVPLNDVAALITADRVHRTVRTASAALVTDFAVERPRLAVLALNPHGGDGGHIGREEIDAIIPAIESAQAEGLRVEGPFPADGFFSAHNREMYDIIIAMYHDQGLIPFKMQAHARGVNISSGFPFVRTSPDHGTAYAIAGHGVASAESMKEAIWAARTIALNRKRAAHSG